MMSKINKTKVVTAKIINSVKNKYNNIDVTS